MNHANEKPSNPSPEAYTMALEVIAGRLSMDDAVDQLIAQQRQQKRRKVARA